MRRRVKYCWCQNLRPALFPARDWVFDRRQNPRGTTRLVRGHCCQTAPVRAAGLGLAEPYSTLTYWSSSTSINFPGGRSDPPGASVRNLLLDQHHKPHIDAIHSNTAAARSPPKRLGNSLRVTRPGLPDNFAAFDGNGPFDSRTFDSRHHLDAISFPEKLGKVFQHLAGNRRETNRLVFLSDDRIAKINLVKRFYVRNMSSLRSLESCTNAARLQETGLSAKLCCRSLEDRIQNDGREDRRRSVCH